MSFLTVDTQNAAWAEDKSGFGFKMLQRMGWSEGKGLGKFEDGAASHVKVKKRAEKQGIGASRINQGNNTLAESLNGFNSLLAQLSATHSSSDSPTTSEKKRKRAIESESKASKKKSKKQSLATAAKQSSTRITYHKHVTAKDVSRYTAEDLSAIFVSATSSTSDSQQQYVSTSTIEILQRRAAQEHAQIEDAESTVKKTKKRKKDKGKKSKSEKTRATGAGDS